MAVSGSFDWTLTRDDAIKMAMRHCGRLAEGQDPTSTDLTDVSLVLNAMLKSWPNEGTQLALAQRLYIFLADDTREYSLGQANSNSDHSSTSFYATTLDGAHSASATSLTVTDGTGIADSDNIGIQLSDGTLHWDTVSSGGTTETIVVGTGLASAADDGAVVYAYTNKAYRPERILHAAIKTKPTSDVSGEHNVIDGISRPVTMMSRNDYAELSNHDSSGSVVALFWDRQWPTDTFHIWPSTDDTSDYLVLWVERMTDDMDSANDNFAIPNRWYGALTWELARWIGPMYGVSADTTRKIDRMAAMTLTMAEAADTEDGAMFEPDYQFEGYDGWS